MTDPREAEAIERAGIALMEGHRAGMTWTEDAELVLRALLSPSSAPCPTCGGTTMVNGGQAMGDGVRAGLTCPDCTDGTVTVPPLLKWSTE